MKLLKKQDNALMTFAADISGDIVVMLKNNTIEFLKEANALRISTDLAKNDELTIKGIRYAKLFPSYSFTFKVIIP